MISDSSLTGNTSRFLCAAVRPLGIEVEKHAGATLLGLGGGQWLRVWLNGSALLNHHVSTPKPRILHELVTLPRPLLATDRLDAIVCSRRTANYLGLAMSLWKKKDIVDLCHKKVPDPQPAEGEPADWLYSGTKETTCLASILRKPDRAESILP